MRLLSFSMVCCIMLLCGSLWVCADETPRVVQPASAGYSAAEQAMLDEAILRLKRVLIDTAFGSQRRLGQNGWDFEDFAAFTAGSLERLGYRTVTVSGFIGTPPTRRSWVLVGIELGPSTTCWIPVDPLPDQSRSQATLGRIPELTSSRATLIFDPDFLTYDSIVTLLPNVPPIAVIRPPGTTFAGQAIPLFAHTSFDPDGEVVLYQWTFPSGDEEIAVSSSVWHTFPTIGGHTIVLTVTDNRGAQASASLAVDVEQEPEAKSCNCHNK